MPNIEKLIEKILSGKSDANISFSDLRKLMLSLGFHERTKGSHHIFVKENVVELVNLQKDGSMAKPYQVRQVRQILVTYRLGGDD